MGKFRIYQSQLGKDTTEIILLKGDKLLVAYEDPTPEHEYHRKWICHWHFVSWSSISLGLSFDWWQPNIEIHLPFGFIRFGFWLE